MSDATTSDTPTTSETPKEELLVEPDDKIWESLQDYKKILDNVDFSAVPVKATISAQDCRIESANIFNNKAEITRLVEVKLPAGPHKILITDLSALSSEYAYHVGGKKGFIINAKSHVHQEIIEVQPDPAAEEAKKKKEARIEELTSLIETEEINLKNAQAQLTWLSELAHQTKLSMGANFNLEETTKFLEFYGEGVIKWNTQLNQIQNKLKELRSERETLTLVPPEKTYEETPIIYKTKTAFEKQERAPRKSKIPFASSLKVDKVQEKKATKSNAFVAKDAKLGYPAKPKTPTTRRVEVTVFLPKKTKLSLHLSYVIQDGLRWTPYYDVHLNSSDKTSELIFYASICNHSGEDWMIDEATKLIVSNGLPVAGELATAIPTVSQFGINVGGNKEEKWSTSSSFSESVVPTNLTAHTSMGIMSTGRKSQAPAPAPTPVAAKVPTTLPPASYRDNSYTLNYSVSLPEYTPIELPSTNSVDVKFVIGTFKLITNYSYSMFPKVSQAAYLEAACQNTAPFPLLTGTATAFVDNYYITSSQIPYTNPTDEFTLNLGVDSDITVGFKQEQNVDAKLGKTKLINFIHSFSVTNRKPMDIEINVLDLAPISCGSKDEVKVSIQKPNIKEDKSVVYIPETSQLKWTTKLPTGKTFQTQSIYQIEVPHNRSLTFYH